MRDEHNGLQHIFDAIRKLSKKHKEHMKVYGAENDKRMSGEYETSNYNVFSFDKDKPVDRGASIRIGYETMKNKKGYFEDRRPASNMDPYQVTSAIFETIAL
jgi:glutamine synthetase